MDVLIIKIDRCWSNGSWVSHHSIEYQYYIIVAVRDVREKIDGLAMVLDIGSRDLI